VTIKAPFYRGLPTHQLKVSHRLYYSTENIDNIMFYRPTCAIVSAKSMLCRIQCLLYKAWLK